MRRTLLFASVLFLLVITESASAMGQGKSVPSREDKVTYVEVVADHPQLEEMVDEEGFNDLSGRDQWELINLIDRYAFFLDEGRYYTGESPSQSMMYLRKAKSLKKEIITRFGRVLK
ncbi:MAG: hypothetical protein JRH07_12770 [Deltaproteobacteria bacterium]|nr:hypothetical protein [Deltaproteobacteria bacterium]MBW2122696.1 hypothetical protein [Deltaproteobacteria bacterium]